VERGASLLRAVIRSLARFIRAALLLSRTAAVVSPVEWDDEDRQALARFMESGTGKKLERVMIGEIAVQNERAAMTATQLACGLAQGFKMFFSIFKTFSVFAEQPAHGLHSSSAGENGPLDELAHLSP
jgi:hypothetical protein